jgi:SCP-2 sterol transfer family
VPVFYSPEWIEAFNTAVEDVDLGGSATNASLAAESGSFRVLEVVYDAPGGELTVTLVVDAGHLRLERAGPGSPPANVTVSVSYEDAAALSAGALDPAEALGRGRIKVRGDLAVLVAGQAFLAAAAPRLGALREVTTY